MNGRQLDLSSLSDAQRAELDHLTHRHGTSWITVGLWIAVMGIYLASDILAVLRIIPLWAGMLINCTVGYFIFSVVHDGVHYAICRNKRLNDAIAQSAVLLGAPYLSLPLFRWGHLKHHRHTNDPVHDPDFALHGVWWTLPFRWAFIDLIYLIHLLQHGDTLARQSLRASIPWIGATLALLAALIVSGYGLEVLMLWFIPSRAIFITLGFSFFWLPHVPHDTRQADNFTRATTVRIGHEWLMAPLLQWQHVHLIHHLYPTTPFYNNAKVWRLIEPVLRQRDLAIQQGFAIQPQLHPAAESAPPTL
ncbi:fatty acid desaturase [Sinimarinibacterium sp. NLF-5-8]|uniref:fatty acid desaturase n=1 Tax=Sinimarinibacterium sp. NLF-5-8 TaxID=2698684 RepID=UPI00137C1465|nr:fatty acid desaturase [Sinimarinibacterium sp. NLF-5-8]QHS11054.1 hypothetical protein GT972_13510 [Sinimarinibacterium sp. NLF-5-8]